MYWKVSSPTHMSISSANIPSDDFKNNVIGRTKIKWYILGRENTRATVCNSNWRIGRWFNRSAGICSPLKGTF